MITNPFISARVRRGVIASVLCLGVGTTILPGTPAYADALSPAEAAAIALQAAEAVDPGFTSTQQPSRSLPVRNGSAADLAQSKKATGPVVESATKPVVIEQATHAGTKVVMGARELWLTAPGTGATSTAVSPSVDVVTGEGGTSTVVQRAENRVRSMVVIPDGDAPLEYSFGVSGGSFNLEKTGSITVKDAAGETVGVVEAPWAVDKNGRSVPTSYSVVNGRLVQQVDHQGAAYPVVADPKVTLGWYIYVRYNKSEVQSWGAKAGALGYKYVLPSVCAVIPHPAAAIACAGALGVYGNSVGDTLLNARSRNQCFELRYNLAPVVLVGWRGYNC